jgi:hypothetical protein
VTRLVAAVGHGRHRPNGIECWLIAQIAERRCTGAIDDRPDRQKVPGTGVTDRYPIS